MKALLPVAHALLALTRETPREDLSPLLDAALSLLARRGMLRGLRKLPRLLERLQREEEECAQAVLSASPPLNDEAVESITQALVHSLQRPVEVVRQPRERWIGGVVVTVGDDRMDLSLKRSLADLLSQLCSPLPDDHSPDSV